MGQLARGLFFGGVVLSQAVRLLATALVLSVITGLSLPTCILIMGVFAAVWCLMGGITTVIWTDFVQWAIYTLGALVVGLWIAGAIPDGVAGNGRSGPPGRSPRSGSSTARARAPLARWQPAIVGSPRAINTSR